MTCAKTRSLLPGLMLVVSLATFAAVLGHLIPLLGGATFGILLGIATRWRFSPGTRYSVGIYFVSRQLLQLSIVALGFGLPIMEVERTGMNSLSVTLVTVGTAIISTLAFGRLLKIPARMSVLIGTGTAICGGSAIAAITPVVQADSHETAYSLTTIFLFNVLAVLLFPPFGRLLGLSDHGFALWAGTAINDTSSVVAAGYSWSRTAGEYATIVKLTRAMLIVPVTLVLALVYSVMRRNEDLHWAKSLGRAVPWFIVWFVAASAVGHYLPKPVVDATQWLSPFMITAALTAVGLLTDLGKMRQAGWRPVALGLIVWISVASSSLFVQHVTLRW